MIKLWKVDLILITVCVSVFSGCASNTVNTDKVNKELLDKSSSKQEIIEPGIEEQIISDANSINNKATVEQPGQNETQQSNPFSKSDSNSELKKDKVAKYNLSKQLEDVFFGFDKYNADQSAKTILIKNAKWLKENPSVEVQLAGYADERGTNNYNISLGQKRSLDIKNELFLLGISKDRLYAISYGEEKPFCQKSTEECWSKNRRVQFLISSH